MRKTIAIRQLPEDAAYDEMSSPVGNLTIITSSIGLHAVLWDCDLKNDYYQQVIHNLKRSDENKVNTITQQQLQEYFVGSRQDFDLPLALNGTEFQIQAWHALLAIPYAATISYKQQAIQLGNKNKARAVGMANNVNPISIIIPCHRVVGSSDNLVGFAGGLERKKYLLQLEQEYLGSADCNKPK
jgi:methylated-DNA-[protein]-cysteine S-methyltransferase